MAIPENGLSKISEVKQEEFSRPPLRRCDTSIYIAPRSAEEAKRIQAAAARGFSREGDTALLEPFKRTCCSCVTASDFPKKDRE